MSTINALLQRMLIFGLSLSAAACASLPDPSAPMALGAAAAAPWGFVDFCQRQPTECGASEVELAAMPLAPRNGAGAQAVAAIQFDWSGVFGSRSAAPDPAAPRAIPTAPASRLTTAPGAVTPAAYDWSLVFAKQLRPEAAIAREDSLTPPAEKLALTPQLWSLVTRTNERINRAISRRPDAETYGEAEVWTLPLQSGAKFGDCEDYVLEKRRALLAAGLPARALSIGVVTTAGGDTHAVLLIDTAAGEYVLDNLSPWVLPWAKTTYTWRERQVAGSAAQWALTAPLPAEPQSSRLLLASLR